MHGDQAEKFLNGKKILDFASNINPFPPKDLQEFIKSISWKISYYPESSYSDLIEIISETFGWDRKEVVFGNGSIELIRTFFILNSGKVLIPYPTFTEYERFAKAFGSRIVRCRLRDVYESAKKIEPNAVVVCNPNNPTGEFVECVEELDSLAEKKGFNLLVDEAFIDFSSKKAQLENAFVVRSLTKILGIPGLRFGYGKFPKKFAERFHEIRDPWNVNMLAKEVAKRYLPKLKIFSRKVRRKISRERKYLRKRLQRLDFLSVGEVNFLLVEGKFKAREIQKFLLDEGILIRTCEDFIGLNEKNFRIAVKDRDSNRALIKNLEVFVEENS